MAIRERCLEEANALRLIDWRLLSVNTAPLLRTYPDILDPASRAGRVLSHALALDFPEYGLCRAACRIYRIVICGLLLKALPIMTETGY